MPDKIIFGKFLKLCQLIFKAFSDFLVNTGLRAEDADDDRFFSMLFNSTTEGRGISFMKDFDDPVIIDGFTALCDFVSAGRTGGDIFGQQLAATLT
jgi:hypothetical protein